MNGKTNIDIELEVTFYTLGKIWLAVLKDSFKVLLPQMSSSSTKSFPCAHMCLDLSLRHYGVRYNFFAFFITSRHLQNTEAYFRGQSQESAVLHIL